MRRSQSLSEFYPDWDFFPLPGPPFIEGLKIIQIEMSQACTRCYANPEERAAFLRELQALAKREKTWLPGQEKMRARADGTGFEFQGMALSPTVQQAGPGVTPSQLLAAAEGAYSPRSQTYRGSVMPTWHPNAMLSTPVRLPMFQHPHGEGFGTEEVGTNRKRLGDRAGPLGQTRSMPVPPSPVAYNDGLYYVLLRFACDIRRWKGA